MEGRLLTGVLLGLSCTGALSACTGDSSRLPDSECEAWQLFFDATSGSNWIRCSTTRSDPCKCTEQDDAIHVYCKNDADNASMQHIVEISMYGNRLRGSFPNSALQKLPELKAVSMLENNINGSLDESMCLLPKLEYIRAGSMHFRVAMNGGIPSCLFVKSGIKGIWLRNTRLGGSAPTEFASTLVELGLEGNNLTGALPTFNYSQFTFNCNLENNEFSCPVPDGAAEKCGAACNEAYSLRSSKSWSCECASSPNNDECYTRWRCCADANMVRCDETVAWGDKDECKTYCDKKNRTLVVIV